MNLAEAREFVASSALNSSVNAKTPISVDRSLQFGLSFFEVQTGCTRTTTSVSLSSDINEVDVTATSGLEDFVSSTYLSSRIQGNKPFQRVTFDMIQRLIANENADGEPFMCAWNEGSDGLVYPKTNAAFTWKITHKPALTSWVPGVPQPDENGEEVTLNIPDRFIRPALAFICATYLNAGSSDTYLESSGWKMGMEWVIEVRGQCAGDIGAYHDIDLEEIQ
jgi:hypothetical protein